MTLYTSHFRQEQDYHYQRPAWAITPTTPRPEVRPLGAEWRGDTSYLQNYRDPTAAREAGRLAREAVLYSDPAHEAWAMARIGALHGREPQRQGNNIPTTRNMSALRQQYVPSYVGGHEPNNDATQAMRLDVPAQTHVMPAVEFHPGQTHFGHHRSAA